MTGREKLEEYLYGLKICDYLSIEDMDEILEDYDEWDKTALDDEFYFYDGNPYEHSVEYDLAKFKELISIVKGMNSEIVKGTTNGDYEFNIHVIVESRGDIYCNFNFKKREFTVKTAFTDYTKEEEFIEIVDAFDDFMYCGDDDFDIYEQIDDEQLKKFFDTAQELYDLW